MDAQDAEGLVTVVTAQTAFQAHAIAAVLHDAEIEAFVFDSAYTGFGFPPPSEHGVPVRVPTSALEEAQRVLDRAREESVDIDWETVDLGEREDDLPFRETRPTGARPAWVWVAIVIATALLLVGVLGWIVTLFF
jgi:hypothetical protein